MLRYIIYGMLLWLTDSALLSYYADIPFLSAAWSGTGAVRLLVRLLAVAVLFLIGYKKYIILKNSSPESMLKRDYDGKDLWAGSAESDNKDKRVLYHSLSLASYFKMPADTCDSLRLLCYCYDIGKFSLPFSVLETKDKWQDSKNARLDEKGLKIRELYESHAELGAEIAAAIPELSAAENLIRYHHEYYNGGGVYGLKGQDIPFCVRIFQVVWAFDSMIYPGRGCRALVCDEALLELRYYSGTAFDPEVVEAFIRLMGRKSLLSGLLQREYSLR